MTSSTRKSKRRKREARAAHKRQLALGRLLRELGPIPKPTDAEQAEIDAELGVQRT